MCNAACLLAGLAGITTFLTRVLQNEFSWSLLCSWSQYRSFSCQAQYIYHFNLGGSRFVKGLWFDSTSKLPIILLLFCWCQQNTWDSWVRDKEFYYLWHSKQHEHWAHAWWFAKAQSSQVVLEPWARGTPNFSDGK